MFDEIRISENYSSVSNGGPMYVDQIVVTASGVEQRNNQYDRPQRLWTLFYEGYQEVKALLVFFKCRGGRSRGFRFKDWDDYIIEDASPVEMRELTSTTFQIQRLYDDGLIEQLEDVTKPVNGTVTIWDGSTDIDPSDYTVDYETGIVTFDSNPAYEPACSCEYDIPVRFAEPRLVISADANLRDAQNVSIVELFDAS